MNHRHGPDRAALVAVFAVLAILAGACAPRNASPSPSTRSSDATRRINCEPGSKRKDRPWPERNGTIYGVRRIMAVPILPESAPFTPSQRAWLNGFFAGVLNIDVSTFPGARGQAGSAPEAVQGSAARLEVREGP